MNKVYVINLKNETKRKNHINDTFTALNVPFVFFEAVDKEALSHTLTEVSLSFVEGSLTLGERACFCSHFLLWQKLIDENMPYMIICEDDVVLSSKIHQLLDNLATIMESCDVLKFETMLTPTLLTSSLNIKPNYTDFDIIRLNYAHMGMAGYVINNKTARKLCQLLKKTNINQPIDHFLFDDFIPTLAIYQTYPALAIQEDVLNQDNSILHSSLRDERRANMDGKKVFSNSEKVKRELLRLVRQSNPKVWIKHSQNKQKMKDSKIIEFIK